VSTATSNVRTTGVVALPDDPKCPLAFVKVFEAFSAPSIFVEQREAVSAVSAHWTDRVD
jgi:hypothetical protein